MRIYYNIYRTQECGGLFNDQCWLFCGNDINDVHQHCDVLNTCKVNHYCTQDQGVCQSKWIVKEYREV